jgi:Baseplate J-like protein
MSSLNTKNFTTLLQDFVAGVQGASKVLLDFTVGSILRAIAQATSSIALWLQGLILQLLATTRLATSVGDDVDTFCVDFMPALPGSVTATLPNGSPRLPAVKATGPEVFSRFTPTNAALVPVGAVIQTLDGTQSFTVVADPTQAAWSPSQNGYVIPAGVTSATGTVQAVNGGTGGNISGGTLTVLQTGISGVDTVTNPFAFNNGLDKEKDSALKARFPAFMNSLSEGTLGAFAFAITSLQQGLQFKLIENVDYNGQVDNGMVTVIIDDGSGNTPAATVNAVASAIIAVRAGGIRSAVFPAVKVAANVVMTIGVAPGFVKTTVQAQVVAALTVAINGIGLGDPQGPGPTMDFMLLGQAAFNVPGVVGVTGVTLNGGTADLAATKLQTIKAGILTVNLAS